MVVERGNERTRVGMRKHGLTEWQALGLKLRCKKVVVSLGIHQRDGSARSEQARLLKYR